MQRALESAISELVLGARLDPNDPPAVDAWLSRHGVSTEDAAALRGPELERLLVYRKLVRGTLRDAIELGMPRAMARLGPLFDEYFARFLGERGPQTHYLRDVTSELIDFCAEHWSDDPRVPDYLLELARLEALRIEIAAAPPRAENEPFAPLDLEAGLAFSEAQRLLHCTYRVHELSESLEDRSAPAPGPAHLLVYRSPDHMVRYLELTPLAAGIVARLLAGKSLKDSLIGATRAEGAELDDATLSGAATLLSDLSARGVLLGPCAARADNPT
ncbi:MAG TPA: hypothetical protein VG937_36260 [Polyangiaceae bacterium]|nr:hypothetical protein [Polyangiaceae bacterium]